MTDIWVCGACSSINRQRDTRCYKCGGKQEAATGALADVRTNLALQNRVRVRYRSSLLRAIVAAGFIIAVAVLGMITLLLSLDSIAFLRESVASALSTGDLDRAEVVRRSAPAVVPGLLRTICSLGALLFFAAWLSRVVANIPSLGGGTPKTTPTRAFVYPLIPIVNLIKVPPIIQDALYRVDPRAGGFFMILLAWIGLVGSAIVSFVAGWWVNLRVASVARNARTLGEAIADIGSAFDLLILVEVVTTLMISVGAVILVLVMFRIEGRARARDREIRAAAARDAGLVDDGAASVPPATAPSAAKGPDRTPVIPPPATPDPANMAAPAPKPPATLDQVPQQAPAADSASGPELRIEILSGVMQATIGDERPEPTTLEELRQAAPALADAGGTATIIHDGHPQAARLGDEVAAVLRAAGVPTSRA